MRGNALLSCCLAAFLVSTVVRPARAQQEVYHPGETYDSLQAGQDAYWDAEAQRRALIARQLMIEEQIVVQNTWADPQDKYRPVHPESYGPILPKAYGGPTLADVYAYPPSSVVYYGGASAPVAGPGNSAAPVPVFQPWPRVPNDIWGAPYYGYVRQPIGHVKIWTSRLGYIYKPIYASPPMEGNPSTIAASPRGSVPLGRQPEAGRKMPADDVPSPAALPRVPPPPPKPSPPPPLRRDPKPGEGHDLNPPKAGQEL